MSKKPKTLKMAGYFPDEMSEQILHKLPIKSLVRFTCVSQTWLSLIKNPNFISDHLKLSISCSNKNPLLLLRYCFDQNQNTVTENYSLYFDDEEEEEEYNHYMHLYFPFKLHHYILDPCFCVVGTVNGLVCLDSDTQTIIIWNPSIKKCVTLPKPSIVSLALGSPTVMTTYYRCVALGFGFDSRSNDYKVLRLANRFFRIEFEDGDGDEVQEADKDTLEAEIYSLNMNSWKTISVPKAGYEVKCQDGMVFVRGLIHVLAFRTVGSDYYRNLIMVFDMGDEVFTEIELHQSMADADPFCLRLLVYKETIAVFHEDWYQPGAYVWVMEDYGKVESWTNIGIFNGEKNDCPNVFGFRKNGELFLQMPGDEEIVSFEPNSQVTRRLGVGGSYPFIDYFVESLELLDNANAQSDPRVDNDAVGDAADDAVGDAVGNAADDAIGDAVGDAADDAVGDAVGNAAEDAVGDAVGDAADDAVGDAAGDASLIGRVPWVLFASLGVLALWSVWKGRV